MIVLKIISISDISKVIIIMVVATGILTFFTLLPVIEIFVQVSLNQFVSLIVRQPLSTEERLKDPSRRRIQNNLGK